MNKPKPIFNVLEWKDLRPQIKQLNPVLSDVIDTVSPGKKFKLYNVTYPYGAEIVKKGYLHFPGEGGDPVPFKELPPKVQADLGYNSGSNPATLILKNTIELFITLSNRIVPYSIINPGTIFGLTQTMDKDTTFYPEIGLWGMTAGARSVFLLPKVSEAVAFANLSKKLNLSMEKPLLLDDQWPIFREMVNNQQNKGDWKVELIFFSKQWFEHLNDKAWLEFDNYLKTIFIQNTSYWRNEYLLRLLYSQIHQLRNIQASPYYIDTVRHILCIALGIFPGFAPAIDDSLAPIALIEKLFIEHYGMKQYPPIIMQPEYYNYKNLCRPVYFSLQQNTALELGIRPSIKVTTLSILYGVSKILQKYTQELTQKRLQLRFSSINEMIEQVAFSYYHSQTSALSTVLKSKSLIEQDNSFLGKWKNYEFPYKAHFLNGCVKIAHAN